MVNYYNNEIPTINCECYCDESTPDIKADSVKIVSWAEGSYDEIKAMIDAHYAGKIDITNYWHIGDTRIEYMSEIPESNGFEYHAGHDIELVLVGFSTHPESFSVGTNAVMIIVKGGLNTMGPMNSEPFSEYTRIDWLNNEFFNSLPIELSSIITETCCVNDPWECGYSYKNIFLPSIISSWIASDFNLQEKHSPCVLFIKIEKKDRDSISLSFFFLYFTPF